MLKVKRQKRKKKSGYYQRGSCAWNGRVLISRGHKGKEFGLDFKETKKTIDSPILIGRLHLRVSFTFLFCFFFVWMGLLRFTRKDKPVATTTPTTTTTTTATTTTTNTSSSSLYAHNNNPATTTASSDFISSSALQDIIQDTSGSGSLLDDILKELHPKQGMRSCAITDPRDTRYYYFLHLFQKLMRSYAQQQLSRSHLSPHHRHR